MTSDTGTTNNTFAELRRRAQTFLAADKSDIKTMSQEDVRNLVHEFDTYQIELELQNEDLRKSQEDLETSRQKYSDLYDFAPVGYLTISDKGLIVEANLTAADMLGVARSFLLKHPFSAFIVHDDQDSYYRYRQNLLDSKERQSCELRIQKKDNSVLEVQLESAISQNIDGDLGQFRVCLTEITQLKNVEGELRKSKEQWEETFNSITDIITVQDKEMHIVQANKAAHDFFKVAAGGLVGQKCSQVFRGTSEPCPECPVLETGKTSQNCSEIIKHTQLDKTFLVSSSAIQDTNGHGQYLVHIAKDITEQKRLEEELFQSHKMEAIGTLAGGIAHDFNNILTAILGYSQFVKKEIPAGSPADKDIDMVIQSGLRAAELVKQILSFSRKTDHHLQALTPHPIIKEALQMLRSTLPATIEIKQDIDKECGKIKADPTNIHQIMVNLCSNALHAMDQQKGTLTVRLSRENLETRDVEAYENVAAGSFVVLSVSDTGHGMDTKTMQRVFEPYFTTKKVGEGSGIGLAVIHGIVQDYKGFVKVASTPDQGSTFSVYLPLLEETAAVENDQLTSQKDEVSLLQGSGRILVVDDEEMLVRLNKRRLENFGYIVTATTDSEEALEKIGAHPEQFDLLITDQTMPKMSGMELTHEVHKIKPDMPVIMSTGHSDLITKEKALEMGVSKYVAKPIQGNELINAVEELLDRT